MWLLLTVARCFSTELPRTTPQFDSISSHKRESVLTGSCSRPDDVHTALGVLYQLPTVRVWCVARIDRAAIRVLRTGKVRVEAVLALLVAAGIGER